MPYPTITILPNSPSRAGDPDNFLLESINYLKALPLYKTQSNSYVNYINATRYKYDDLGLIINATPAPLTIQNITILPDISSSGETRTLRLDQSFNELRLFSEDMQQVGAFFDVTTVLFPSTSFDSSKPLLNTITATVPTRSDSVDNFNNRFDSLMQELRNLAFNTTSAYSYIYNKIFLLETNGLLTESSSTVNDLGIITVNLELDDWGFIFNAFTSTDDRSLITSATTSTEDYGSIQLY